MLVTAGAVYYIYLFVKENNREIHLFTLIHYISHSIINKRWMMFTEIDQVILEKKHEQFFSLHKPEAQVFKQISQHKHALASHIYNVYNCPYLEVVNQVC